MTSIEQIEMQRERWQRYRRGLRLLDPTDEDFGTGGLSRLALESTVRLLILSGDPEATIVEFDDAFWSWWKQDWIDPSNGHQANWGTYSQPTNAAAIQGWKRSDDRWRNYLAFYRHGGLEMHLGDTGTVEWESFGVQFRAFPLIRIVGRIWAALDLYRQAVQQFNVEGPWELTIAFSNTAGSVLGNVGEGWAEPGTLENGLPPCAEPGILLRREMYRWPDQSGIQSLVFSLGGWIEDSWGSRHRRFLAYRGPLAGKFDTTKYGWY